MTLALVLALALARPAQAQEPRGAAPAAVAASAPEATLTLIYRQVVTFRSTLLGDTPAVRVVLARAAIDAVRRQGGPGRVSRTATGDAMRYEVDGTTVFFLVPDDLAGPRPEAWFDAATEQTELRLQTALAEAREATDPRRLGVGAALAAVASVVAFVLIRLLMAGRRRAEAQVRRALLRTEADGASVRSWAQHLRPALRVVLVLVTWALMVVVVDLWATFVLNQFAYTRPWGEQATVWLLHVLQQFALAAAGAVPGLVTAVLIFAFARLLTHANTLYMERVEVGELTLGWVDCDTAGPTRRVANLAVWLFALAMAYPYLPGANSEAFKGVTVLAGLMLSLGATGVVGQATSGLSLMYARALRVGEYVRIGETEGTVTEVGLLATKLHTGLGEEVSLPNAVVLTQPVRNFSRLVDGGRFVLHACVTIGYATPWRQVHAMLLEAARRTPGVADDPPPYVVQTALSDFYVEYRLCAQGSKAAPRRRAEAMSQLHAHVQDVFNENGVQIMSPHYLADPPQPQVVPPGPWASKPGP